MIDIALDDIYGGELEIPSKFRDLPYRFISIKQSSRKNSGLYLWKKRLLLIALFGNWNQSATLPTRYFDILIEIERGYSEKRPEFLRSGVLWLDDNARPHSATAMQNHIVTLGWKRLHHPPELISHQVTFICFWLRRRISPEGALEAMPKSNKPLNATSHIESFEAPSLPLEWCGRKEKSVISGVVLDRGGQLGHGGVVTVAREY
ncbi:hypothetical protein TNCV_682141 [Trichonephila clavipes]|nr:hypothetical protein TNCV_682141 [Trichonephila clavipes]